MIKSPQQMTTILLTGATGTLGSRILFSLMEQRFDSIEKIILPVRKKAAISPERRIQNMLGSDTVPQFVKDHRSAIEAKIEVVDAALLLDIEKISIKKIDYFIHSAGYVNLSTDPSVKAEIFKENFEFSRDIFRAYSNKITKFVYISTAFSSGDVGGLITNDYSENHTGNFRNYYEASKHQTETFLLKAGRENNLAIQILRPSVLGGNIADAPNYFISKYMVFYLFAKFFHNNSSKDAIRIATNSFTGLNIIPTDYAANVICKVLDSDIEQLNIVHSKETNMMVGVSQILDVVGFTNFSFTQEQISKATGFISKLEEFYYETIGVHLHPYMNSKPSEWDTTLLESILPIPNYDLEDYLMQTVSFAKNANFRNQKW